jgi:hypothetical protein
MGESLNVLEDLVVLLCPEFLEDLVCSLLSPILMDFLYTGS